MIQNQLGTTVPALSDTQKALPRIWTRIIMYISYNDDHYTTSISRTHTHTCVRAHTCSIFSFKHIWLNSTDTSCLPILSLIRFSLCMNHLTFEWNEGSVFSPNTFSPNWRHLLREQIMCYVEEWADSDPCDLNTDLLPKNTNVQMECSRD